MSYTGRGLSAEEIEQYSGDKVVATSIIFAILTSIFLGLRFYSKSLMRSRSGWDDILLVAAYLFNVGLCAVGIAMTKFAGVGRHEEWVRLNDPSQIVRWAQFVLVFQFLHFTGVGLPKIAILFFYIRVFNWKGGMLATCYATMGLLVATWLACDLAACFQCRPLAFWWDNTIPGGTCFNVQNFYRAQAITSPILDTIVLVLPMRSIWGLNLPERKRIELLLVFGVASVGLVASIVRVQIFFTTAAFKDRTWASVDLCGWSVIEVGTYIITACLPEMKPLVPFLMPTRLVAKARSMITISSTVGPNPTKKARLPDYQTELPSLVTHDSNNTGPCEHEGPWDGTFRDMRHSESQTGPEEVRPHKQEIIERTEWESDGGLTILVTRTTEVTVDTLGSFDRPWEYLGPSIGSPTIGSG